MANSSDQTRSPQHAAMHPAHAERAGVAYGLAAYVFWGLTPLYFKALTDDYYRLFGESVRAFEILVHRIVWSLVFLAILMTVRRQWSELIKAVRTRQVLLTLIVTTALIGLNWFVFIWTIEQERLLDASLGYYMNPLVNVLLGFLFLHERLRGRQLLALVIAAIGVGILTIASLNGRTFPWPALVLAFSFGFYGLLRKIAPVNGVPGLTFETALLAPFALWYIWNLKLEGTGHFLSTSPVMDVFLIASGLVTIFPLICFANAARRLRLSTLGFIQYIAPTENFILGALVFREDLTWAKCIAFLCIWVALAIYTLDLWKKQERRQPAKSPRR